MPVEVALTNEQCGQQGAPRGQASESVSSRRTKALRRRRILLWIGPLFLLAAAAFVVGAILASGSPELDAAKRFATAWETADYDAMYAELNPGSKEQVSAEDFKSAYEQARETATLSQIQTGEARGPISGAGGDEVAVRVEAVTDSFGTLSGELAIPVANGGVTWNSSLVFPGLKTGETLDRETKAPKRAPILAADGLRARRGTRRLANDQRGGRDRHRRGRQAEQEP